MGPRINLVFFPTVASANFGTFKSNKNMIFLRSSAVTVSMFPYLRKKLANPELDLCVGEGPCPGILCSLCKPWLRQWLCTYEISSSWRIRRLLFQGAANQKRRARIVSGANCPWDPLSTIFVERCNVRNVNLRAEPAAKCLGQRE